MTNEKLRLIYSVVRELKSSFSSPKTIVVYFNYLANDKTLDQPKFKALADDKINVTEKFEFVLGREENILGKGENASYPGR